MENESAANKAEPQTRDLSGSAMRITRGLSQAWQLTEEEQMTLLGLNRQAYEDWSAGRGDVGPYTIERLSYLLGIFKAINTLLPQPERADAWIRKPNSDRLFNGRSAMDLMMSGEIGDLQVVRRYLDAELV